MEPGECYIRLYLRFRECLKIKAFFQCGTCSNVPCIVKEEANLTLREDTIDKVNRSTCTLGNQLLTYLREELDTDNVPSSECLVTFLRFIVF